MEDMLHIYMCDNDVQMEIHIKHLNVLANNFIFKQYSYILFSSSPSLLTLTIDTMYGVVEKVQRQPVCFHVRHLESESSVVPAQN